MLDNQDAVQLHRVAFYRIYLPLYQKVKSGTHLIDDVKYEELVKLLSNPLPKGATMAKRNNRRKYQLVGNIAGHCFYRNGLVVTTIEKVFDVMLEVHIKLNHLRSNSKNKECIKEQLGYYGVPSAQDCSSVLHRHLCHGNFRGVTLWYRLFITILLLYFLTLLYIYVPVRCKQSTDEDLTTATEHDSAKKSR